MEHYRLKSTAKIRIVFIVLFLITILTPILQIQPTTENALMKTLILILAFVIVKDTNI